ncbi:serine-rich adhesin for platelets-like isoform X2 [Maniola hyperantus]|uniref:serine-rich adhesin for platelets-like isoform X2 n=1 Tax=Aphantopus hyperantus TaxID=2795564 RepID=UPI00374A0E29
MDDEVEDIVGDVQYTDSQKSVTTSVVYSLDFTDSSPERYNSSGKETYIIEQDESDDSEATFHTHINESLNKLAEAKSPDIPQLLHNDTNKPILANINTPNFTHESTQTSKTIIELAKNEIVVVHNPTQSKSLETQTSYVSIKEHKTVEYKIHLDCISNENEDTQDDIKEDNINDVSDDLRPDTHKNTNNENINTVLIPDAQSPSNNTNEQTAAEVNTRSNIQEPDLETTGVHSEHNSKDKIISFIDDESIEREDQQEVSYETTSEVETSKYDSDIEEDSLMLESEYRSSRKSKGDYASETSEVQNSIENDVEELYNKLSDSPFLLSPENSMEPRAQNFGTLTPLTEETSQKKSFLDITTSSQVLIEPAKDTYYNETLIVNAGLKVKMFTNSEIVSENDKFRLPPIHNKINKSCPTSPHLNFLFSVNTNPLGKVRNLPCLLEGHSDGMFQRWEVGAHQLASGESPLISGRSDPVKISRESVHLPPIHVEGAMYHNTTKPTGLVSPHQYPSSLDAISISDRIRELKTMTYSTTRSKGESRSMSPSSNSPREESRMSNLAERGCDNACVDLLRRLRSSSWVEVLESLEDIPRALEKFWSVLTVNRTAELLRQMTALVDSPRTQVARSACSVLAHILKNTNYTRKPDFYEAISMLLTKTGSFSRPVRRAANVALDDIACGLDVAHAATAICIYGVGCVYVGRVASADRCGARPTSRSTTSRAASTSRTPPLPSASMESNTRAH